MNSESGAWPHSSRTIPLCLYEFVAESPAKDHLIRDCLSTAGGLLVGGSALTGTHTTAVDHPSEHDEATRRKGAPVIEIDHVTKRFGDYTAVADADFSIASGEFFSMLAPRAAARRRRCG